MQDLLLMAEQKDIPVCTLFKENDDPHLNENSFSESSSQQELPAVDSKEIAASSISKSCSLQDKTNTDEPGVCNIFQAVPSTEDLFANITSVSHQAAASQYSKGNLLQVSHDVVSNEAQHMEATTENAEKVLKKEAPLRDSKTALSGDSLMASEKQESTAEATDEKISCQSEPENSEAHETALSNSDLMTSIMINDSLDNLSYLSMDQNTDTETLSLITAESSTNTMYTATNIEIPNAVEPRTIETENFALELCKTENTPVSTEDPKAIEDIECNISSNQLVQTEDASVDNSKVIETPAVTADQQKTETLVESQDILNAAITNTTDSTDASNSENGETEANEHEQDQSLSATMLQPPVASVLFSPDDKASPFDNIGEPSLAAKDDAFADALQMSETDRRQDAWLSNEHTQTILNSVLQSQKRIKLEPKFLTRPGLATSESLGPKLNLLSDCCETYTNSGDPVKAVLARYKGISNALQRKTLAADEVANTKEGLQQLIKTGNYRAGVDLCGKVLSELGQGFGSATQQSQNSPDTLKWWHARLSLLMHLKLYEMATTEFTQFGSFDTADLYYEFYPDLYPGRKGSMVPFSLRLLYADFPRHINNPNEALSRLYAMLSICNQILTNLKTNRSEDGHEVLLKEDDKQASIKLWNDRKVQVMYFIGNALLQLREYYSAINVMDEIITLAPTSSVPLLSSIGRTLLQLGDVKAAQQRFAQAEQVAAADPTCQVSLIMNRAFLYLGANNWKEALTQFDEVLQVDPTNIDALNNKSVCLLYLCRLKDAITVQEQAVKLTEEENLSRAQKFSPFEDVALEGALSNLVTLYELESSKAASKKQSLLHQVAVRSGDGFNVSCLKV